MSQPPRAEHSLCAKIARLVQERGWNQEEFARHADLNRLTVRAIFQGGRKLHNATVRACAEALGLAVHDLQTLPLERLMPRIAQQALAPAKLRNLHERATQPELKAWVERHPERAAQLSADEIDELLSLQGSGGPLTAFGVAHFVEGIERRRKLLAQVAVIAGTEYVELLESLVQLIYEKIQPYRDRAP